MSAILHTKITENIDITHTGNSSKVSTIQNLGQMPIIIKWCFIGVIFQFKLKTVYIKLIIYARMAVW